MSNEAFNWWRWVELLEDDDTRRLSTTRFCTIFVVFVLAMVVFRLVEAGTKCQTARIAVECFGPVESLADTMALLAVGAYALARAPSIVKMIKTRKTKDDVASE